ncbi:MULTISPECIES: endonuclease/exonuclease/phosphatase family protein [Microvirgula]|mgnify:CR=1 FL=1|uniref:Endonuclease/exonuclease/phosphatase domain-containing protein n=1 Tax=Microvirgula aerodenitrificans TaxID=57480 RepID=A0A2S0PC44_9NEIS|nr:MULTISPECIES: endonuclease/exonuclease/phosphatase family protein [Microvirgula]AVY94954.1 hypothetical protein DAI18_13565 [Microvirgula aerodenitrificans]RAS10658.1 endonuclease/exonuclease/phosphatase family metal-dependent hydrolase [Microvirgula sp. AG722]
MQTVNALRIASFNIHKGMSPLNRHVSLPGIAQQLELLGADVLFLQEVQGRNLLRAQRLETFPSIPQHDYLARKLSQKAVYGLNAGYDNGHHGNAILSRFPIRQWCNRDISVNRLESRGLLHCDLSLPGWPIDVTALCVHLNLLGRDRRKQMAALAEYIAHAVPAGNGLILAGDFNDWRARANREFADALGLVEVHQEIHGRHGRSFPARLPLLRLDRIYVRGLSVSRAEVLSGPPWSRLSDHLPLSAELLPAERVQ